MGSLNLAIDLQFIDKVSSNLGFHWHYWPTPSHVGKRSELASFLYAFFYCLEFIEFYSKDCLYCFPQTLAQLRKDYLEYAYTVISTEDRRFPKFLVYKNSL